MTQEQVSKVLNEIQAKVPKEWRERATETKLMTPTVQMVTDKVIEDPKSDPALVEKLKHMRDAGEFSKTVVTENPKFTKMIDNFVSREINKAIKEGRLPSKKKGRELFLNK